MAPCGWNLIVTWQGQLKFSVSILGGAIGKFVTVCSSSNLTSIAPQECTHVMVSFNDRSLDLFINGVLVASQFIPGATVFRDVVHSQMTVTSDSASDMSVLIGAAYQGPSLFVA